MKNKAILINLALFLGLMTVYAFIRHERPKFQGAPQFSLPLLADSSTRLNSESFKGAVVLNFWASWCEGCKEEVPFLEALSEDVQVIGIATSESLETLPNAKQVERPYPLLLDERGAVAKAFKVRNLPQTILIQNGRVQKRFAGQLDDIRVVELEKTLASLRDALPVLGELPEFQLTGSEGQIFDSKALADRVWVTNFMYTSCESMCSMQTKKMQSLQTKFKEKEKVNFVSVSVDPSNDTPEVLRAYGRKFDANPERWFFLTGDWKKIRPLITDGFKIGVPKDPAFHSDRFVLLDGFKRIRGYYSTDSSLERAQLRRDIEQLLKDPDPSSTPPSS